MRFPVPAHEEMRLCVRCGAALTVVATGGLGGDELGLAVTTPLPLEVLIDNIRSAFNVGSIIRSANGAGVRRVHLCGFSPTPAHPRVARTALGSDLTVPWEYATNALERVRALQASGATIWALEGHVDAVSLFDATLPATLAENSPLVLVAGNEVTGVDPGILAVCDRIVALPMRGSKVSLNVAVATGAALMLLGERLAVNSHQLSSNQ